MEEMQDKSLINILGKCIALFALIITILSINTACIYIAHQPKIPKSAKALQKF